MITFFQRIAIAFLWDELAFVRWMRGLMFTFAGGGVAFADQIADIFGAPGAVKAIKLVAVLCMFLAGSITAGERNPKAST